jgi:excisionase family DNA binding protein
MTGDDVVMVGEAARIIARSEDTVRRLADQGLLPAIRISRGLRLFQRRTVEEFAARLREQERRVR